LRDRGPTRRSGRQQEHGQQRDDGDRAGERPAVQRGPTPGHRGSSGTVGFDTSAEPFRSTLGRRRLPEGGGDAMLEFWKV
jgi:hypothetical protein